MKGGFGALDLFQDVVGFGGPDERFGGAVVLFDVSQNRLHQGGDVVESAAPELLLA